MVDLNELISSNINLLLNAVFLEYSLANTFLRQIEINLLYW